MFNTFEQECEINLSEKYPNTMIKVYTTNQIGCFKDRVKSDMIEIYIIPTDFVDYKISDLQLQNIIWRVLINKYLNIKTIEK